MAEGTGAESIGDWTRVVARIALPVATAGLAFLASPGTASFVHALGVALVLVGVGALLMRLIPPFWGGHRRGRTYVVPCLILVALAASTREMAHAASFSSSTLGVATGVLGVALWAVAALGLTWHSSQDLKLTMLWILVLAPSLAWILASCANIMLDRGPRRTVSTQLVRKWDRSSRQSFGQKFIQVRDFDDEGLTYLRIDPDRFAHVTRESRIDVELAPGLFGCPWVSRLTIAD